MPTDDKRKAEPEAIEAKAKVETIEKVDPNAGLVRMRKGEQIIHAHPNIIKEHEKNGWKVH